MNLTAAFKLIRIKVPVLKSHHKIRQDVTLEIILLLSNYGKHALHASHASHTPLVFLVT